MERIEKRSLTGMPARDDTSVLPCQLTDLFTELPRSVSH